MRTLFFCASLLYVAAGLDDTEVLLPTQPARAVEQVTSSVPDWVGTTDRILVADGTD